MNLSHLIATTALVAATAMFSSTCSASDNVGSTSGNKKVHAQMSRQKLGPEYKKMSTFIYFRKKLLSDGWRPVANPDCHDAVLGHDYDRACSRDPKDIDCRQCTLLPETFRATSDGYMSLHYVKDGTPLNVTVYGDTRDLDEPGKWGLAVVGWTYDTTMNVILLDD